jgi:hypothetical protein
VVHFVGHVLGIPVVSKELLSRRTDDYRDWVGAFAHNHKMEGAEKGLRKEDHVLPASVPADRWPTAASTTNLTPHPAPTANSKRRTKTPTEPFRPSSIY